MSDLSTPTQYNNTFSCATVNRKRYVVYIDFPPWAQNSLNDMKSLQIVYPQAKH